MYPHNHPFDPTGGYSKEQLLALQPVIDEPVDFAAFWRETFDWAASMPLDWSIRPSTTHPGNEHTEVFDMEFASLHGQGNRIGGWLTLPRGRPVRRGAVICHGYGGRAEPDLNPPFPKEANVAAIFPCCTGLPERSRHADIRLEGAGHVLHGIERRETYVHRFCVADVWRAASVLQAAVPETRERLDYLGGSFGGGIGALALAWDARFAKAHLSVPSFGNHPLRLGLPCCGSGEAVRVHTQRHPETREVLRYFDAATAARHIKIPVHVEAAFFDPAVPPAGQFSVYHALGNPAAKRLFASETGHHDHAGKAAQEARLREALLTFFAS
ncbi:deacetylase [Opitutaceae bacterium TAV4]|nr:deacetylase [Opitutaceae bacterium TAV4]RRK00146.1 deacetylase [Opitutaceae bacterium TAV3]